jgi:spermidine synthase
MLLLNGQRQFAEGSHHTYSYYLAEYPARLLGTPATLILGCGSMSTLVRIGSFVPRVKIVDLDERVCAVSQKYFQEFNRSRELKNWDLQADDAKHFLGNGQERFGLILHDIPPARTRQTALTYTREFFQLVKDRVEPGGLFSIASLNALNPKQSYGKKMLATLASVFDRYFVILYRGSAYFYGGDSHFAPPDQAALFNAIDHSGKQAARVLTQADVEAIVKGVGVITVSNVGELIYD